MTVATRVAGPFVEVAVRDNGCGIPSAVRHRIFDPFMTTKPLGKGTGRGLAIVHAPIVNRHGRTVRLDSEVGRGTTFTLALPRTGAARG
ncbi:MAG TPA: ATP-binding protein [Gemmataceae bacterium]|nr:ATP-binding protein [Gemmataceae bacterium]